MTENEKKEFDLLDKHGSDSLNEEISSREGEDDYLENLKKENKCKNVKTKKKQIFPEFKNIISKRYEFREPEDFESAMTIIVKCAALIHFYCMPSDEDGILEDVREWSFAQLMLMNVDFDFWKLIASCVYNKKTGIKVYDDTQGEINVGINKIYEVIMVFAQGIMSVKIADIYESYCGGIPQNAIFNLLNFLHENDKNSEKFKNPNNMLTAFLEHLFNQSLPGKK